MSAPDPKTPPVLPWRGETARHRSGWPEGYWRKVVWRGLRLRCPVCGKGELFRTEDGQWVGSLDINTFGVALLLMIGAAFTPSWSLPVSLGVWCAAAILVPLVTFRFSRGLWMAIVHLTGGVY